MQYLNLLSAGSASNEALHREINTWFRNQQELYISTLQLQLRVNHIAKLWVHNNALYSPALREKDHRTLLVAFACKWKFPQDAWFAWVGAAEQLPLSEKRTATRKALQDRRKPRRITFKKPSAECVYPKRTKKAEADTF